MPDKLKGLKKQAQLTLRRGLRLTVQEPGLPGNGPITFALRAMMAKDEHGLPVSPLGEDIARLTGSKKIWVLFVNTNGAGAVPWRRFVMLDGSYRRGGQVRYQARVGLVAHELTHVLQRELNDPLYWPTGFLRPGNGARWVFDSTNYMEVLAYMVGWTVEYDLLAYRLKALSLPEVEAQAAREHLEKLRRRITTMAGQDIPNAIRYILKLYTTHPIYRQNYRTERRYPDGRIPSGGWAHWLSRYGISNAAVAHLQELTRDGPVVEVPETELVI